MPGGAADTLLLALSFVFIYIATLSCAMTAVTTGVQGLCYVLDHFHTVVLSTWLMQDVVIRQCRADCALLAST